MRVSKGSVMVFDQRSYHMLNTLDKTGELILLRDYTSLGEINYLYVQTS